jgi:hypothetical protein
VVYEKRAAGHGGKGPVLAKADLTQIVNRDIRQLFGQLRIHPYHGNHEIAIDLWQLVEPHGGQLNLLVFQ